MDSGWCPTHEEGGLITGCSSVVSPKASVRARNPGLLSPGLGYGLPTRRRGGSRAGEGDATSGPALVRDSHWGRKGSRHVRSLRSPPVGPEGPPGLSIDLEAHNLEVVGSNPTRAPGSHSGHPKWVAVCVTGARGPLWPRSGPPRIRRSRPHSKGRVPHYPNFRPVGPGMALTRHPQSQASVALASLCCSANLL